MIIIYFGMLSRVIDSLVNSSIIVLFLTAMVGMILMRALHKDIARYNLDDEVSFIYLLLTITDNLGR